MENRLPIIDLRDVIKKYPIAENEYYQALNGVSLCVNEGDFLAIMGPSGSGKSTLMHIMGALDTPSEGAQFFKGKDISSYSEDKLADVRNTEIGFVFQAFNLLPKNTVYENVERPMIYGHVPAEERKERVEKVLAEVGVLDKAKNLANHISGGQIQRVAIARALIMNPSIVLADEPTGNLDTRTGQEIMNILQNLNNEGKTIVLITHDVTIAKYAKRLVKLVDGKVIADMRMEDADI